MKSCPTCQAGYLTHFAVCPQDGTPLVEYGAWAEGTVIRGKYRVLEKIGQGGMGSVYKALHVTFGTVLDQFRDRLLETLDRHQERYFALLEGHFVRHLEPFSR